MSQIQDTEYEVGQINNINDKELENRGGDESGRLERCRGVLSHSEKIRSS